MVAQETTGAAIAFVGLIDLAAARLGGQVLLANDEFFAEKENLLLPGRGLFIPERYTDRGKWMDGWETRRRRNPGYDWCIVQLGLPGIIRAVDIDTNHFLGNHPPYASLDACTATTKSAIENLAGAPNAWVEILPRSPLRPGSQNLFVVQDDRRRTHVRLNIYPDGGVARLRVYGEVWPDWSVHSPDTELDLASLAYGGRALCCSDMFFSDMNNLLMPGEPASMADGWETRRRRDHGHDWVIVQLGRPGILQRALIDTTHFKGNAPAACSLEAIFAPGSRIDTLNCCDFQWQELLPKVPLQPDQPHAFDVAQENRMPVSHVRLNIYPDGGVARLRLFGKLLLEG